MEFPEQGYQRNIMWNFQGLIKKTWNFQGWPRKNNVEFSGVFVFGLGISKGSNTILWNIQGLSFFLSGISRGKVKKWKILGGFKKVYPQPSCLDFFWNSPSLGRVVLTGVWCRHFDMIGWPYKILHRRFYCWLVPFQLWKNGVMKLFLTLDISQLLQVIK